MCDINFKRRCVNEGDERSRLVLLGVVLRFCRSKLPVVAAAVGVLVAACIARGGAATAATTATSAAADPAAEMQAGNQVYSDLSAKHLIVSDSPYAPELAKVGARVAKAAGVRTFPERFYIVIGNQMNAFSAPDGRIYVNEGLLRQVDNEDELANVLAHESAHIVLGHLSGQMQANAQKKTVQTAAQTLIGHFDPRLANPSPYLKPNPLNPLNVMNELGNYGFLSFTRKQETEADEAGLEIAAKAGYNPYGTLWFLRAVGELYGDAGYESYVQHHPSIGDRIADVQAYIDAHRAAFAKWSDAEPAGIGLPLEDKS